MVPRFVLSLIFVTVFSSISLSDVLICRDVFEKEVERLKIEKGKFFRLDANGNFVQQNIIETTDTGVILDKGFLMRRGISHQGEALFDGGLIKCGCQFSGGLKLGRYIDKFTLETKLIALEERDGVSGWDLFFKYRENGVDYTFDPNIHKQKSEACTKAHGRFCKVKKNQSVFGLFSVEGFSTCKLVKPQL